MALKSDLLNKLTIGAVDPMVVKRNYTTIKTAIEELESELSALRALQVANQANCRHLKTVTGEDNLPWCFFCGKYCGPHGH